jgi:putative transposase
LPDEELVAEIMAVIAELPTYGYRRVHAILVIGSGKLTRPAP